MSDSNVESLKEEGMENSKERVNSTEEERSATRVAGAVGHEAMDGGAVGGKAAVATSSTAGDTSGTDMFGYDVNAELAQAVSVSKYTRQYINYFKGVENHCYNKALPAPASNMDWETELQQATVLEDIFPDPRELSEAMACSWCEKIAEPPVYMCKKGHLICGKDLRVVPTCPHQRAKMCYAPFVSTRPLFIEYIYNNAIIECRNQAKGCPVVLLGCRDHSKGTRPGGVYK